MNAIVDVDIGDKVVIEKRTILKYSMEMECLLVKTILSSNAHKSSTSGTNEVKFTKVVDTLWSDQIYQCKGKKRDWSTVRHKFLTLLNAFKKKVGLGTSEVVNCSALPDVDLLTEIESLLYEICRDEETANREIALDKEAASEKAAIKDGIADVIVNGGGKQELSAMAKSLVESKPSSKKYRKLSDGFGNPVDQKLPRRPQHPLLRVPRKKGGEIPIMLTVSR